MTKAIVPQQMSLKIAKHREVNGLEMGVMSDGTPYLSARGLAAACGVAPSNIITWASEWSRANARLRDKRILELLEEQGHFDEKLFIPISHEGKTLHAYPEPVVMAVLEYYAFDAKPVREQAIRNYRLLARSGFKAFVYVNIGFDPQQRVPALWQQYHERLLLNNAPVGFFSVLKETADIVLTAIRHDLHVDEHTVPDISVGVCWGQFWTDNRLDAIYGERTRHPHIYPEGFPQRAANPDAWVYPLGALGEFRSWLQTEYLPTKFPSYIRRKLPASAAAMLIEAVETDLIGSGIMAPQLPEGTK
jgi:hypothetical protein